jgi:hypothetical protein
VSSGNFPGDGYATPSPQPGGSVTLSLVALSQAAVDAVWGMGCTADAAALGFSGGNSGYSPTAASQTQFALGNVSGPAATFSSEKMRGADVVFGSNNVAAVFPVNDSPILDYYAFNGVSAGNPAAGGGQSGSVSGTNADVVGGPMAVADGEGAQTGGGATDVGNDLVTNDVVPGMNR